MMKNHFKYFSLLLVLCFTCITMFSGAQTFNLKSQAAETDLKIIGDSAYFFMDRKDVMDLIKQLAKQDKKDYSILIKKMKGVCFESINLRKEIDDQEITAVQYLIRTKLLALALQENKVAVKWKKGGEFLSQVFQKENPKSNQKSFTDADGKIVFPIQNQ